MSISVFPDVIGQTDWKFRLPVKKTPVFTTVVVTPANNVGETRTPLQSPYTVWEFEYDLAYMFGTAAPGGIGSPYTRIVGFYGQMKGSASDWLYFDPDDNGSSLTQMQSSPLVADANLQKYGLGTGDGVTKTFVITRQLGGANDLIQNFVPGYPKVYDNGVVQTADKFSIDAFGNLTFVNAPASGHALTWAGQFFFRCRFLEDQWSGLESIRKGMWKNSSVKFRSLLR